MPAAAALEHLAIRDVLDLDAHVETVGALLRNELRSIAHQWPQVFDPPRGHGLMLGLPVREPHKAADFVPRGLDFGLIINAAGRNTLRFVPPLIISPDEVPRRHAALARDDQRDARRLNDARYEAVQVVRTVCSGSVESVTLLPFSHHSMTEFA